MKITKKEIDQMIKEEFQKMWKKRTLSKRLSEINESLSQMEKEDSLLSEVEASGMQKTSSATGLVPGEQPGVKFDKLNATTLKEDGVESDGNTLADMGLDVGVEKPSEVEMSMEKPAMGEFEAKFAELGKSIDAKLASETGADSDSEEISVDLDKDSESDEFEEVEVDSSSEEGSENGESGAEDTEKEEEIDETKVVSEMEKTEEEGIEGKSVAQDAPLSEPDGDMKKDTVVNESEEKEAKVITEVSAPKNKNIFLEGIDSEKQAKILAEQKRMRKFAGLSNEDEE
jgi:hypothetical protein